jgi:hypothetical protein
MDSLEIPAVVLDEPTEDTPDFPWGTEVAKSLTISAAQTAGVSVGFVVAAVAFTYGPALYKRLMKKNVEEIAQVHDITTLPKQD